MPLLLQLGKSVGEKSPAFLTALVRQSVLVGTVFDEQPLPAAAPQLLSNGSRIAVQKGLELGHSYRVGEVLALHPEEHLEDFLPPEQIVKCFFWATGFHKYEERWGLRRSSR